MNPKVFRAASTGDFSFFEKDFDSNLLKVTRTHKKNTVLHVALQFNQFEAAEKIINLCRDLVSIENSKGNTPLHVASRAGTSSIVKLLIEKAKDIEAGGAQQQLLSMVNHDEDTALHVAVKYCNFEVVKELINKKDPAELVNKAGESALFLAVERQRYDIAFHILKKAETCSYGGRDDMNVLHALAFSTSDCKCCLNLLLKYFSTSLLGSFVVGPL